jgi:stage V sporulation protein G
VELTEIRIKLIDDAEDKLRGFCSITLDHCFVVRDIKIIDGPRGPFVAMPSRKIMTRCGRCGCKNHLKARYCNQCGRALPHVPVAADQQGRPRLHADIAHPINPRCRDMIQTRILAEYAAEVERAHQPGYRSRYDDGYDSDVDYAAQQPRSAESPVGVRHRYDPPQDTTPTPSPHVVRDPRGDPVASPGSPDSPADRDS